ncbi:hypothetical protein Fcan01_27319 [Folsomia candida]|uniref:Transposable element Tc1 transposase n=1 Tax=Folsomia candida TaxID=158441 RepID=A0A226D0U2_FOLCA|nr:hypothetical protein Fcan01_27319 [Folsomia candida]
MARRVHASQDTVRRILNQLDLFKRKKYRLHRLLLRHKQIRKAACRSFYEKYLAGRKWELVVFLDEGMLGLQNTNGDRPICYVPREKCTLKEWVVRHDHFYKLFIVVGVVSGRGTPPLFRVPKIWKVNVDYYTSNVLEPLIEVDLRNLHPGELKKVVTHDDAATSHTARKVVAYAKEVKQKFGITIIEKSQIMVKSPDASKMDFFGFGYLKKLFKQHKNFFFGLWKVIRDEWSKDDRAMVERVMTFWN